MFIQTEATPNPATVKFIPGQPVMASGSADFRNRDQAASSPLALRIFDIRGVEGVFLGNDFISVTKNPDSEWSFLKPQILAAIMEHYLSGLPVHEGSVSVPGGEEYEGNEIVRQIREILDSRVRPAVAKDGGDIVFVRFSEGIAYLQMRGACAGCPSSTATLKMGIENLLRHYVPEVRAVEQAV